MKTFASMFALVSSVAVVAYAAPSSEIPPPVSSRSPSTEGRALLGEWCSEYDPFLKGVIVLKIYEVSSYSFKGRYTWSNLKEPKPYERNVEGSIWHNDRAGYDELTYASSEKNVHALAVIPGELVGFIRDFSTEHNLWPVALSKDACRE